MFGLGMLSSSESLWLAHAATNNITHTRGGSSVDAHIYLWSVVLYVRVGRDTCAGTSPLLCYIHATLRCTVHACAVTAEHGCWVKKKSRRGYIIRGYHLPACSFLCVCCVHVEETYAAAVCATDGVCM